MQYRTLGRTSVQVSSFVLGTALSADVPGAPSALLDPSLRRQQ